MHGLLLAEKIAVIYQQSKVIPLININNISISYIEKYVHHLLERHDDHYGEVTQHIHIGILLINQLIFK